MSAAAAAKRQRLKQLAGGVAKGSAAAVQCGAFWCVPVRSNRGRHFVYLQHDDTTDDSVLLCCNLDPLVSAADVRAAFGATGATLGPAAGQARITFASEQEADAALRLPNVTFAPSTALSGWSKYVAECQQRPDPVALAREVDDFMERFDAKTEATKQANRELHVDADGFVLVTRKRGRRSAVDKSGAAVKATAAKKHTKAKPKADPNFYQYLRQQVRLPSPIGRVWCAADVMIRRAGEG